MVLPIDQLNELQRGSAIGSVGSMHYAFIGATPPARIERAARQLALSSPDSASMVAE